MIWRLIGLEQFLDLMNHFDTVDAATAGKQPEPQGGTDEARAANDNGPGLSVF